MPFRSMKMNFFILGFQRRVWCPKWTPASSNSFIPMSATRCTSGLLPPPLRSAGLPEGRPPAARGVCSGGPHGRAAEQRLPLGELEALPRPRLSVLLALLHARVAREESFLAEKGPQRRVDDLERARHAERHRAGLAGRAAA